MKLSKVLKKDIIKHLGITPERRRKDFKQFIAENGGYNNAIETLKSRLNEKTEFKAKKEVRSKQIIIQKEYIERKQIQQQDPRDPEPIKRLLKNAISMLQPFKKFIELKNELIRKEIDYLH